MKKYLIKGLDFIFGLILSNVVPAPIQTSFRTEINSILVIRPGGIGDAVLLLPMLHELALLQPDAKSMFWLKAEIQRYLAGHLMCLPLGGTITR